jgi:hypothetical protein
MLQKRSPEGHWEADPEEKGVFMNEFLLLAVIMIYLAIRY